MTTARNVLVIGTLLVMSFVGLGRDLWTPDEPREAEISREMWLAPSIVPSLNEAVFIEKPPLYYWTVAGVFELLGQPSAAAARAVSAVASFLTLLVVLLWGRRDFSPEVGLAAAFGLATSEQFAVSSHWVLIDPLLMLFTTVALSASCLLVRGSGTRVTLTVFYGALALALWTKGLIGPVLVAAGLLAYCAMQRSVTRLRRFHVVTGLGVLVLATATIAVLIDNASGPGAVREWLWVNHVQRFFAPTDETGHAELWYYYLWVVPVAVFPWWVPLGSLLRPATWRRDARPEQDSKRESKLYLGALTLGMLLVLSVAATKRGNYLLPVLPPLFLLLAAVSIEWWKQPRERLGGWLWWTQVTCVALFAVFPVAGVLTYVRRAEPVAVAFLAAVAVLTAAVAIASRRGLRTTAASALAACSLAAVVGLFIVCARLLAPLKDMTPFVASVGELIPRVQPIYVSGNVDETLRGIVPFVTSREVVPIDSAAIDALRPLYILMQRKEGDAAVASLEPKYEPTESRTFGQGRQMVVWRRTPGVPAIDERRKALPHAQPEADTP